MRPPEDFQAVRVVVRNTARYPIAALSDGCAFRNSLLAVFETHTWPAAALVALLNSALIRWLHYMRFRDARQPVMPQVKISHLRQIPAPVPLLADALQRLTRIGERLSQSNAGASVEDRQELDSLVANIYELNAEERQLVSLWHDEFSPRRAIIEEEASQFQPPATHGPRRGRPRGSRPA
jgi:hypothetical protein